MPGSPDAYVDRTYDQTVNARTTRHRGVNRGKNPAAGRGAQDWWPKKLELGALSRNDRPRHPMYENFDYAAEFRSVNLDALADDVDWVLHSSKEWWPADFGHYGPLILRMAWHGAGTYRISDGRGGASAGMLRFSPLNNWPDNRNLDKARRLLWPVKQKYGRSLSWADLMVFAGNRALESMGFTTYGFAGGREDVWEPDDTYWGPESEWFADERHTGIRNLNEPLAASEMGLIYVDPQGPATVPDPVASARDIRQTFHRMGMNDVETVALIAGGHTFGKTHGTTDPAVCLGRDPDSAAMEDQGLGWSNHVGTGSGAEAVTSGLEGIWTPTPITWDNSFLETLYAYEWDVALSPAGLWQWIPSKGAGAGTVPDAHDPSITHVPTMLTTDLALQEDRKYGEISRHFLDHPDEMADAFARAWFKLTHLDMGPRQRYLGALAPAEPEIWQDPVPEVDHDLIDADDIAELKLMLLGSGLSVERLVSTAWASASTFRNSDKRGGANGARIRLDPQRDWDANDPCILNRTLSILEQVRERFNSSRTDSRRVSLADLIVLGGCVGVERAAARAGHIVDVPFRPGRTDATAEWTDPEWMAVLEPVADGFRNYIGQKARRRPETLLVDHAAQLTLTAPQMTVLLGGLRAIGVTHSRCAVSGLTSTPGLLTNEFFVNLLDGAIDWSPKAPEPVAAKGRRTMNGGAKAAKSYVGEAFEGRDRRTGDVVRTASRIDLVFYTDSELRPMSEAYASAGADEMFVRDFVRAWDKVMNLDRFD